MKRRLPTKLQLLDARHPGLIEKVHAMFEEFRPMQEVRQMIQPQYGECLGLRSLARYKSEHWQAQRELVQQMSVALAASPELAGEARLGVR